MLANFQKITPSNGQEWLLKNDRKANAPEIVNYGALARRICEFQDRSCGAVRLDMEEGGFEIPAFEEDEIEVWRTVELTKEMEGLLDLLRAEGVAGLAQRMRCTPRSVQQKLKKLVDEGVEADLLNREVA